MSSKDYTGREIAIFTDVHGLVGPLCAVLEDIERRGIREIYSLGDNIGLGPDPCLVLDILEYYNVKSIAGNSEEYCMLGVAPYKIYFDNSRMKSQEWLMSKLNNYRLNFIKTFPHSIDLNVGGKDIAICHFANDVRCDYTMHSYSSYMNNINTGDAYKQFLYTNSLAQKEQIRYNLDRYGYDNPNMRGFVSALNDPLFGGKTIDCYDTIIQGHVHFKLYENADNIQIYTIRALAMAYGNDPIDMASYIILREKNNNQGFDVEEVLVRFDREAMENSILMSDEPSGRIKKYVKMK